MTVAISETVITEVNNLRRMRGLESISEEDIRERALDKTVQEFSNENRRHEFVTKDLGETGGVYFIPGDFRLIGFFDNKAIFTRSGLTESELESQKLQQALDEILAEEAVDNESPEPIDFLERLRLAEEEMGE